MAIQSENEIFYNDIKQLISNLSISDKTITVTKVDGTTYKLTTKDTTYSAATSSSLGLVKVGSNITNNSGTISLSKANIESALGYTINASVPSGAKFTDTTYSAGTGISLSGTAFNLATVTTSGGTAGPTANATPAFGATFTVPKVVYDKYGRVTGHTNYTVKIPTVSGVTLSSNTVQVFSCDVKGGWTAPSGGTWAYLICGEYNAQNIYGVVAGGTYVSWPNGGHPAQGIAFRISE